MAKKPKQPKPIKPLPGEDPMATLKRAAEAGWKKTTPKAPYDGAGPLKGKMELFCHAYIVDLNATQAAIIAKYSKKTAQEQSSRLLSNVMVKARVAFLQKNTFKKLEVTAETIMAEVAKIAFSNLQDFITVQKDGTAFIDLSKCSRDQLAALSEYTVTEMPPFKTVENGEEVAHEVFKVKIKQHDKLGALGKLMQRHNLVKPIEVNHTVNGTVTMAIPDLARRMAFMLRKAAEDTKKPAPEEKTHAPASSGPKSGDQTVPPGSSV